ncbi:S-adenosyl-L-methionine-dependent methyltransferase [Aspergillus sclerotioniger CBS 115572]|uniref:S-adenosyl-L-methionine-dependent methyltransferase n=1 Tax=Aspergillus sclerotioniger CBS 115572 TaxID=1450535 RepID=A0A317VX95_9EURO|nr:S-adenosyl-L-methionine-dependent methyltransferase [Aspergillus sclerotioniger CBS 115572]PWY78405.1 S-adenosyl-L-methionine-dependent methyltransferase [Aspergillus sclerotioniger CBS 115572]
MASTNIPALENPPQSDEEGYEERNVHEVYQQIASHFSSTRYKPWPIVERFLKDLKPGAIGLDVGCGNGKYLAVNRDVFIVASDRSANLARIAQKHQPHSTIIADILHLPHPDSFFDFAISIAVIHHLSTPDRRVQAIREILRTLKPATEGLPGGKTLIYAWALEQKNSRRGWDKGDPQDIMVPWVMKGTPSADAPPDQPKVFHRYYHLYEASELEQDINKAGGRVLESGYEKDNWWAIATRTDPESP